MYRPGNIEVLNREFTVVFSVSGSLKRPTRKPQISNLGRLLFYKGPDQAEGIVTVGQRAALVNIGQYIKMRIHNRP